MPDHRADGASAVQFIHSLGDACLVVDESLDIAAANQAAESLYLPTDSGLTGTSLLDWCPQERRDALLAAVTSCNGAPSSLATSQLRGDGTSFQAEVTAATCVHHAAGSVTLLVRERAAAITPCRDDLEIRNVALENALDGIVVHTIGGKLLYANKAACTQWGVEDMDEVLQRGDFGWVPDAARDVVRARVAELHNHGEARFDSIGKTRDGIQINVEVHARLVETDKGPLVVSTARDVTERIQTEEMVRYLAYHDMLTGLANRVQLDQELSHQIAAADRHGDTLGVIFLDLNDFKPVNDTYGHAIGDHVLREVADRLVGCVRESDTVARLGGDEFVIVLPRLSAEDDLPVIAKKVSDEISRTMSLGRLEVNVSATVGMALHQSGEDAESLLIRADLSMYDARERCLPGWEIFAR